MFRKKPDNQELQPPEEQLFDFWLEYFSDACEEEKSQSTIRFPVSIWQLFLTVCFISLSPPNILLEIRVIMKIEPNPFYPRIL